MKLQMYENSSVENIVQGTWWQKLKQHRQSSCSMFNYNTVLCITSGKFLFDILETANWFVEGSE